ncbi:MAG: thioredoxin family protein [Oscillospiraceae bacterium]|nr:thioredoxin family protein [Oscillospiraceae bacterium]
MAIKTITKEAFDLDVKQSTLPVLLEFWAPWCTYCRRLGPVLDRLAEQLEGKVAVGKVNIDEQPDLESRFGVEVIPTLYLFRDGAPGEKLVAPASQEDISNWLQTQ